MTKFDKQMWRLAEALHEQLIGRDSTDHMSMPMENWRVIEKFIRQIRLARQREWHLAADRLAPALASAVAACRQRLLEFGDGIRDSAPVCPVASVTEIYRDLVALRVDFDDVCADRDESELYVTTMPIALDGLHLGPFQIRLCWTSLNQSVPYRVVVLEPNPAHERPGHPSPRQRRNSL